MINKDLATAISLIEQCRDSRICPIMIQDILSDALYSLEKVGKGYE